MWWLYGVALFIAALPHSIFLSRRVPPESLRKCPHCEETIQVKAKVCHFCSRDVPFIRRSGEPSAESGGFYGTGWLGAVVLIAVLTALVVIANQ